MVRRGLKVLVGDFEVISDSVFLFGALVFERLILDFLFSLTQSCGNEEITTL